MDKRRLRTRKRIRIGALAMVFTLAAAASTAAQPDGMSSTDRRNAYAMLEGVRRTIESDYYDPTFRGLDLGALANVAREGIGKAGNLAEALAAIAQFELELDDPHTTFMPPRLTAAVDYGWTMGMVGNNCYVIDLDPQGDAAHQGVAVGDQLNSVNGLVPTRANLWRLNYLFNDLHPLPGLHVELVSPAGQARTLDLASKVHPQKTVLDLSRASNGIDRGHVKAVTVRSMPDVLLVRMPSFLLTANEVRGRLLDMHERAALILDLRGNGGGAGEALNELLGELYGDDLNLGTRQMRGRSTDWVVKGAGRNAYTGHVLVLVDAQSAAASELFARAMQLTDRGTVIGDQTLGAVMESARKPLLTGSGENAITYGTTVTIADIVMSDGGRLEKIGVTPDFVVLPSAEDLSTGRDPALAQALGLVGHHLDAAAAAKLYGNR